jgi:peptidoglycan-associated lipoprotein
MKFSTIMAVFTVALAVAASGCKYDKAGGGAGEEGAGAAASANEAQAIDTDGDEVPEIAEGPAQQDEGRLSDIVDSGRNFEDLYARCNDVSFAPVYFGFDSTVVPQGELGKIEAVASHLASNASRVVVVEGHCDDRGSNEYNVVLGENRAIIIRNYLVQNGISADRIQTRSYGEERPAVSGEGESAWSKNRRGEFAIFQK